jgi:hypothetical protein
MTAAYNTSIPAAHPFFRSAEKARAMQEHLSSSGTLRAEHADVERWVKVEGRELLRLVFQEHLELRAAAECRLPAVVGADGVERTEARAAQRGLETVFGEVDVRRLLYQHGGRVGLAPQDGVLNLPRTHYSHVVDRKRTRLMKYSDALRDGLPISTGVIEGACRYLVKDRMDRTGARWTVEGAEAVLMLRAIRASGDFDDYWRFHLAQEKERNHANHYAHARIPSPLPAAGRHLRSVK